ncbi:MAG TPA: hypothetical protein DFR83_11680 [Deltaproteobacteria bacterium]|nr:hypothetical protein [Deltaproteobacteria bacterium]
MQRWLCLTTMWGVMACGGKDESADNPSMPAELDSATQDSGTSPGCTQTDGELAVTVTVDGYRPADVADYRALVRSGEEDPIEVMLSDDAVGEISLEEGAYSVSAVALDDGAGATWIDFVAVLACARTEVTVDMVGIGR